MAAVPNCPGKGWIKCGANLINDITLDIWISYDFGVRLVRSTVFFEHGDKLGAFPTIDDLGRSSPERINGQRK